MSVTTIQLTARDPIIARDGRPFGAGQGNRMRGLAWPLPSVVAGSFRTALVKANPALDFTRSTPLEVLRVKVAGVFPTVGQELYLPAPGDCLWNGEKKTIHAVKPLDPGKGGCDFPIDGLRPVMLSPDQSKTDFKPESPPAWWPISKMTEWLLKSQVTFDGDFLGAPIQETRDHVYLDFETGAAKEGQIFATTGLNLTHLTRYGVEEAALRRERFAPITLSARVTICEKALSHVEKLDTWHPLGGERRLIHWKRSDDAALWKCPEPIEKALANATRIRMVLVTPAIFDHGWRPRKLDPETLEWQPLGDGPRLKLVGVTNPRWKAVSGWAMAPHKDEEPGRRRVVPKDRPGPKAIRRMVPAGAVYFFELIEGNTRILATNGWLNPVSDQPHDRHDGFGLAVWGVW